MVILLLEHELVDGTESLAAGTPLADMIHLYVLLL